MAARRDSVESRGKRFKRDPEEGVPQARRIPLPSCGTNCCGPSFRDGFSVCFNSEICFPFCKLATKMGSIGKFALRPSPARPSQEVGRNSPGKNIAWQGSAPKRPGAYLQGKRLILGKSPPWTVVNQ